MGSRLWSKVALAIACLGVANPADAALVARNLDGNAATIEAYFDTVLNVTWLKDANLAASQTLGVGGIASDGTMTRNKADEFITAMNAGAGYLGVTTWRLPGLGSAPPSELEALYTSLGNPLNRNDLINPFQAGPFSNLGPFTTGQDFGYWLGDPIDTSGNSSDYPVAWYFSAKGGFQSLVDPDSSPERVFALTSGDVGTAVGASAVPLPAAIWLLGSGLGAFGWFARRKRAA